MVSYLVTLVDKVSGGTQQVIVNSECDHGMSEFINQLVADGDPGITLACPVIAPGGIEVIPEAVAARLIDRTATA